jgi:hypothetical protein
LPSTNGTRLADDVVTITQSRASKITARRDSAVWPVLDLLARQPVVNAAVLETKLGLDYMRQKRSLDVLEAAGVVVGVDKFKKGRFWRAPEMLEALDAFAERAGRRSRGLAACSHIEAWHNGKLFHQGWVTDVERFLELMWINPC